MARDQTMQVTGGGFLVVFFGCDAVNVVVGAAHASTIDSNIASLGAEETKGETMKQPQHQRASRCCRLAITFRRQNSISRVVAPERAFHTLGQTAGERWRHFAAANAYDS